MKVEFTRSFEKDLKKIRDLELLLRIKGVIEEIENSETLDNLTSVKKLKGYDNYYRIRVGDYRLGVVIDSETFTFIRALSRKDIYRYFP